MYYKELVVGTGACAAPRKILGDLKGESLLEEARLMRDLAVYKLRAVSGFKRRLLDVELARFDTGKSDIRRLYDVEQALSEARKCELESFRGCRKASVDFAAASGITLRDMGFERVEGERIVLAPVLLADPRK